MADVGVLIIHGIGWQKPGFSLKMQNWLKSMLGEEAAGKVIFQEVVWAEPIEEKQIAYMEASQHLFRNDWLRSMIVRLLGDAAAYSATAEHRRIHRTVYDAIRNMRRGLKPDGKTIILAHSLGGHIMSNFIFDLQIPSGVEGATKTAKVAEILSVQNQEVEELQPFVSSITAICTFGCNIALFALGHNDIQPIEKPSETCMWYNYYDEDDVLGYPLKTLNGYKDSEWIRDERISVGRWWALWETASPLSHLHYWTDKDLLDPIVGMIRDALS